MCNACLCQRYFPRGRKDCQKEWAWPENCAILSFNGYNGYWNVYSERNRLLKRGQQGIITLALLHLQPMAERYASASPRRWSMAAQSFKSVAPSQRVRLSEWQISRCISSIRQYLGNGKLSVCRVRFSPWMQATYFIHMPCFRNGVFCFLIRIVTLHALLPWCSTGMINHLFVHYPLIQRLLTKPSVDSCRQPESRQRARHILDPIPESPTTRPPCSGPSAIELQPSHSQCR